MCMNTQTQTYTHACTCAHTCMHTHTHARIRTCTYTHTHTNARTRTHARVHAHTHAHTCTHIHTYTHKRAHAHTHTHTPWGQVGPALGPGVRTSRAALPAWSREALQCPLCPPLPAAPDEGGPEAAEAEESLGGRRLSPSERCRGQRPHGDPRGTRTRADVKPDRGLSAAFLGGVRPLS